MLVTNNVILQTIQQFPNSKDQTYWSISVFCVKHGLVQRTSHIELVKDKESAIMKLICGSVNAEDRTWRFDETWYDKDTMHITIDKIENGVISLLTSATLNFTKPKKWFNTMVLLFKMVGLEEAPDGLPETLMSMRNVLANRKGKKKRSAPSGVFDIKDWMSRAEQHAHLVVCGAIGLGREFSEHSVGVHGSTLSELIEDFVTTRLPEDTVMYSLAVYEYMGDDLVLRFTSILGMAELQHFNHSVNILEAEFDIDMEAMNRVKHHLVVRAARLARLIEERDGYTSHVKY